MASRMETGPATSNRAAEEVVRSMCVAYASAVNASDSIAYSRLFTEDAIRMPPGAEPEFGQQQIQKGEQAAYDDARLSVRSTPADAVRLNERWIYAIADVEGTGRTHADGTTFSFRATKTWLLEGQASGEWLIARQMWNLKPPA